MATHTALSAASAFTTNSLATGAAHANSVEHYAHRFSRPLPRQLAQESHRLNWLDFLNTYAPQWGPLQLQHWSATTNLHGGLREYTATFHLPHSAEPIRHASTIASGEIRAAGEMLHQLGFFLEISRFTQHSDNGLHSTIIHGLDRHGEGRWAVGFGETAPESAIRAMLAAVARLYQTETTSSPAGAADKPAA